MTLKILIILGTVMVIFSLLALFHLMVFMRKKIDTRELNYWFIILLGIPIIGAILYLGFIAKKKY